MPPGIRRSDQTCAGSGEICWALDFSFAGGVGVEGDGECVGSLKVLFGERTGEGR